MAAEQSKVTPKQIEEQIEKSIQSATDAQLRLKKCIEKSKNSTIQHLQWQIDFHLREAKINRMEWNSVVNLTEKNKVINDEYKPMEKQDFKRWKLDRLSELEQKISTSTIQASTSVDELKKYVEESGDRELQNIQNSIDFFKSKTIELKMQLTELLKSIAAETQIEVSDKFIQPGIVVSTRRPKKR